MDNGFSVSPKSSPKYSVFKMFTETSDDEVDFLPEARISAEEDLLPSSFRAKPPTLAERSLSALVAETPIRYFEIALVQRCPRKFFPRLLAASLLLPKPRLYAIRLLLKHWPLPVLSMEDLKMCHMSFDSLFDVVDRLSSLRHLSEIQEEDLSRGQARLDRILVIILETFAASIAFANHRMRLKCLDLHSFPWTHSQHDILYKFLNKYEELFWDWSSMEPKAFLRVPIDLLSLDPSVIPFWSNMLRKCPTLFKSHSLSIPSPLVTGDSSAIRVILKQLDKSSLLSINVRGELMFNEGGGYETDVDHLQDAFHSLYKQTMPQWMPKLKQFKNLVELDLSHPTPTPQGELEGKGIVQQTKMLKRLSPCALENWIQIFPMLPPTLRHLLLKGQLIQGHLEELLHRVQFNLFTLDLEGCGLTGSDLGFIGISRHRNTLKVLKIGDLNMGKKFEGLCLMLKGIKQLETLDLGLEGYDRFTDNVTLDDCQVMEIIYLVKQQYSKTLKIMNFGGGHHLSKAVLMKAIKHILPLRNLELLNLPAEGLSTESVQSYEQYKRDNIRFKYKLQKCGPEFNEIHRATYDYLRRDHIVTTSLSRYGIAIQVNYAYETRPSSHEKRQARKKLERKINSEILRREREEEVRERKERERKFREKFYGSKEPYDLFGSNLISDPAWMDIGQSLPVDGIEESIISSFDPLDYEMLTISNPLNPFPLLQKADHRNHIVNPHQQQQPQRPRTLDPKQDPKYVSGRQGGFGSLANGAKGLTLNLNNSYNQPHASYQQQPSQQHTHNMPGMQQAKQHQQRAQQAMYQSQLHQNQQHQHPTKHQRQQRQQEHLQSQGNVRQRVNQLNQMQDLQHQPSGKYY